MHTLRRLAPDGAGGMMLEVVLLVIGATENNKPHHKHGHHRIHPLDVKRLLEDKKLED